MKLSNRILNMEFSSIRSLIPYAEEAEKRGINIYHLNIGQPDIKTPDNFFNAISNFKEDVLKYTQSEGITELQKNFIDYYRENLDTEFTDKELIVTNGGSEALLMTFMAIFDPGDEVISPEPFYTNYNSFAQISSTKIVPFLTKPENGFHISSKSDIVDKITKNTKAIIISNPSNPTGVVYSKDELRILGDIVKEYDLYLIADEVYREFIYDGLEFTSALSMKDIQDRIIIIDSMSKRYSACGARIGIVASKNKEFMYNIMKLCQSRLCTPTIEQIGASALWSTPKSYFEKTRREYESRRNLIVKELNNIPGVSCNKPEGAFYIIAKLPVDDSEDFVKFLLRDFSYNKNTVMLAPATGFYATPGLGKNQVRISYCINKDSLKKAMNILKLALEKYNN
ncbi:pyridoxal phosphate-dependent aminotransferase [Clostridium sp. cel8]|jgi:aspartate aminotransferase|uniref:pyridoxal phosphate-dependent aminotransferase n=1 Tax=unclassified Clostridium TaxID=2614128 RepID=UPI0015F5E4DA|nr:pyridoxal phosphate-dependent aminotransferase [Clostridium sp. cel8]MBA5851935.1 pyridoxal phosphate-dependent aminotransferase [Clostridium sp. cel8]